MLGQNRHVYKEQTQVGTGDQIKFKTIPRWAICGVVCGYFSQWTQEWERKKGLSPPPPRPWSSILTKGVFYTLDGRFAQWCCVYRGLDAVSLLEPQLVLPQVTLCGKPRRYSEGYSPLFIESFWCSQWDSSVESYWSSPVPLSVCFE